MSYLTANYYEVTFQGEPVDTADFPSLLARASEIIEEMTMYRVTETIFAAMPENMQELIRKAICTQIEYLDANGDMDNGADIQSAGLGRFNYTQASGNTYQSLYSPRAMRILRPTGLLYRGGGHY